MENHWSDIDDSLDGVQSGLLSTIDVILMARSDPSSDSRLIALVALIEATPHLSDRHKATFFDRLALILELTPSQARRMKGATVEWLLDGRARPGRIHAWIEVSTAQSSPPWPGYPFEPGPRAGQSPLGTTGPGSSRRSPEGA